MSPDFTLSPIPLSQVKTSEKSLSHVTENDKPKAGSPSKRGLKGNRRKISNLKEAISNLYKDKLKHLKTLEKTITRVS